MASDVGEHSSGPVGEGACSRFDLGARREGESSLFSFQFARFCHPERSEDLYFAADCRSLASLGMTTHERRRSCRDADPIFTMGCQGIFFASKQLDN